MTEIIDIDQSGGRIKIFKGKHFLILAYFKPFSAAFEIKLQFFLPRFLYTNMDSSHEMHDFGGNLAKKRNIFFL